MRCSVGHAACSWARKEGGQVCQFASFPSGSFVVDALHAAARFSPELPRRGGVFAEGPPAACP